MHLVANSLRHGTSSARSPFEKGLDQPAPIQIEG